MIKLYFDIETIPSAEEDRDGHVEILKKRKSNAFIKETFRIVILKNCRDEIKRSVI